MQFLNTLMRTTDGMGAPVLSALDADANPVSLVVRPRFATQVLLIDNDGGQPLQAGAASLLWSGHDATLNKQTRFRVRGQLERDGERWLFRPVAFEQLAQEAITPPLWLLPLMVIALVVGLIVLLVPSVNALGWGALFALGTAIYLFMMSTPKPEWLVAGVAVVFVAVALLSALFSLNALGWIALFVAGASAYVWFIGYPERTRDLNMGRRNARRFLRRYRLRRPDVPWDRLEMAFLTGRSR